ncbi:hypothetical protein SLE2022_167540 [Rubroshorea leprosula]
MDNLLFTGDHERFLFPEASGEVSVDCQITLGPEERCLSSKVGSSFHSWLNPSFIVWVVAFGGMFSKECN